ncbi:hypothetical protein J6590_077134 [Homalodisca vitripennis]|nr:hypothetical protein J6590_077134 [Homalodisca vitripennis]
MVQLKLSKFGSTTNDNLEGSDVVVEPGPYMIVKVLSQLNLVLKVRNRKIVVHVNRVKPYVSRTKVNQVTEVHIDNDVGDIEIPDSNICIDEGMPSADDIPVGTPRTGNRLPRVKRRPARLEDYVP